MLKKTLDLKVIADFAHQDQFDLRMKAIVSTVGQEGAVAYTFLSFKHGVATL